MKHMESSRRPKPRSRRMRSTLIDQSYQAFSRELALLLTQEPNRWVAYSGKSRLGIANTQAELIQRCLASGLTPDQFLVLRIEPEQHEIVVGPQAVY